MYTGVNECNKRIYALEDLENTQALPYIAELKGLRALYYYWLMDLYGNIVWITDFEQDLSDVTNTLRGEVYNSIHQELDQVMDQLSTDQGGIMYGRINRNTALMIKAKLYLNSAVYTGSPAYEGLMSTCDEILNSGDFRLEDDYFDVFKTENERSSEIIFSIPFEGYQLSGFNLHMMTLHPESQKTYNLLSQPWNGWCAVEEFFQSYEAQDKRRGSGAYPGSFIYGPQYATDGGMLTDEFAEPNDPDGPSLVFTTVVTSIDSALRQDGARIGKFEVAIGATPDLSNDFPVFRYADVLLMKAEGLLQTGKEAEARALVNQVRVRSGLNLLDVLTEDELLAERGRELFVEMHRRSDLIRLGKFNDTWWEKDESESCKNIFPIPYDGISASGPRLIQNECY